MILKLVSRRLLVSVLILLVVSIMVFVATLLLPGDPAQAVLGQQATPERLAALREQMNLNDPVLLRYLSWLGGLFTGNFGYSAATAGPVSALIGERITASLVLMGIAAVISIPVGIIVGTYSALRRGRFADHVATTTSLVLAAMPEFVIGIVMITLFSTTVFKILPSVTLAPPGEPVWNYPLQLVLPALTLVLVVTPYIVRMMRATMIEVLDSGFVEMARLKGVPERTVILRHAVPHALGPVAQVVAIQLAWMAGGVVVIEFLFRYPGIGQALVDAVANRDVQVVQAISMLIAAAYIVVNLLADIVGIATNPKLRTESAR
ncbi:ABC transporter permease [Arthrobacter rhombi]|uniref:Dipeptide transport system permease protein DppB (TC 3.A.1.5.2) n=1 Tax=Arthrobacter rhombi TaxID=71253 RepID=A0A1R4EPH2_9MICC|nr:ABC transporter permease [Arthrobacter rhombi]SJM45502.1 Dipeptide transport system permease protein DppB (TC 3.A.1.5.2) [Arthrobacter rhombi]